MTPTNPLTTAELEKLITEYTHTLLFREGVWVHVKFGVDGVFKDCWIITCRYHVVDLNFQSHLAGRRYFENGGKLTVDVKSLTPLERVYVLNKRS